MYERLSKYKNSALLSSAVMSVFFAIILLQTQFMAGSDDEWISTAWKLKQYDWIFVNNRVLVNLLTVLIEAAGIHFWRICNLMIGFIIFFYMQKYVWLFTDVEVNSGDNLIWLSFFFMFPMSVLSSAVYWVTGSFSYIYGGTCCLIFLYPFLASLLGKDVSFKYVIFAIIGGIYAGNLEQSSAVQVVYSALALLALLKQGKRFSRWLYALWVLAFVSFLAVLLLPYNASRLSASVAMYMPDYYSLSVFGKIFQGVVNLYEHLAKNVFMMIPLAFLLTANAISRDKAGWKIGLSFLPLLYYIICLLSRYCYFYKLKWLCEFNVYHFHSIESFGYLLALAIHSLVIAAELYLIIDLGKDLIRGFALSVFYAAGLASCVILGFSPTMLASNDRIFLLFNIFAWLVIGVMTVSLASENKMTARRVKYIAMFFLLFDLVISLHHYFIMKGMIIYY